jgi:undecaprenyl-diphosphatase
MHDLLRVVILGIIEGITEFLPISSTGHLLIAEHWLGYRSELFNVGIQAGAILAITLVYWQRIWELLTRWRDPGTRDYLAKLVVAFLITAVLGFVAVKLGFKLPVTLTPIAWALIVGGIWMIGAEQVAARMPDQTKVTWPVAILVGIAQMIAGVFPGTSRSAASIFAAMLFGTSNRPAATEFAFLVGIPTMYAATGYELLKVWRTGGAAHEDWGALVVGFVVSLIVAFIAVKWLLRYIRTHRFTPFAIYRIVLGALILVAVGMGWMHNGGQPAKPLREVPTSAVAAPASREAATYELVTLASIMDKRTSPRSPFLRKGEDKPAGCRINDRRVFRRQPTP